MVSAINPTHPISGQASSKAAVRANFGAAKAEIEELQNAVAGAGNGVSVKSFGAVGDGVANDTDAIQAAINFIGEAGGGVLYLPTGIYKIIPPIDPVSTPGVQQHTIVIDYDNITLQGDGMWSTIVNFRGFGDVDPLTLSDGFRGHGFFIKSDGTDEATARKNVVLRDFQLAGGCDNAGTFDVSHKAVLIDIGKHHRGHLFERIWLNGWRGESLHHQGNTAYDITVDGCRVSHGRANAFNINGGRVDVRRCEVWDMHSIAEDVSAGPISYIGNYFHDCTVGISCFRFRDQAASTAYDSTSFRIIGNLFENIDNAIVVAAPHTTVLGNDFIDCGVSAIIRCPITNEYPPPDGGIEPVYPRIHGVLVAENTCVRKNRTDGDCFIVFSDDDSRPMHDVRVINNLLASHDIANGWWHSAFKVRCPSGSKNVVIEGNVIDACRVALWMNWAEWPAVPFTLPVWRNNDIRGGVPGYQTSDEEHAFFGFFNNYDAHRPTVVKATSATQPLIPPVALFQPDAPFAEPQILSTRYMKGTRMKLSCVVTNAPVLIAKDSTHFRVDRDRFLYPNTFLEVEFDGERFQEIAWIDRRTDIVTTQTTGTTLDAQGRETVTLNYSSPTTITAHQGFPEYQRVTVLTTNALVTLANNAAINLLGVGDLTLDAGIPRIFMRIGSVLWQVL